MLTIKIAIGSDERSFTLVHTNAPKAYDHGAALELYDGSHGTDVTRYVLVPTEAVEWQRGRNHSGLHSFETDDLLLDERDLQHCLWRRFYPEAA